MVCSKTFFMLELIPKLVAASQLLEFPGRGFPEFPAAPDPRNTDVHALTNLSTFIQELSMR